MAIDRRTLLLASPAWLLACTTAPAPAPELGLCAAGPGSNFLPYAQGLAAQLQAAGLRAQVVQTTGSIENLRRVNADATQLGLAFLGTVHEATAGGAPWTQGQRLTALRALFPMYETSFQLAALTSSGLAGVAQLQGRRVGVGPAGGPAESFFQGLVQAVGLQPVLVTGTPSALSADLLAGRIDALWQGASVPIPSLQQLTAGGACQVFGLTEEQTVAMRARFPFLARSVVPAGTYRGQAAPITSVAAWNFVVAHQDLAAELAWRVTQAVLELPDPRVLHASAGPTRAENARMNTVLPFHPGAVRYYRERGISV